MKLLEGFVEQDNGAPERVAELEAEVHDLQSQLTHARADALQARRESTRALSALRSQLQPLYRALQMVFGELDAAGVEDSGASVGAAHAPRVSAVWESWKQKMPGKPAEFIDILLQHGEMTAAQLRIAGRCASDTVYSTIYKLNKAGLVEKNGGRFSLKKLPG